MRPSLWNSHQLRTQTGDFPPLIHSRYCFTANWGKFPRMWSNYSLSQQFESSYLIWLCNFGFFLHTFAHWCGPLDAGEAAFFLCDVSHCGAAQSGRQGQLRHKDWFCSAFAVQHFNIFSVIASCQRHCDGKQTPLSCVCVAVCIPAGDCLGWALSIGLRQNIQIWEF